MQKTQSTRAQSTRNRERGFAMIIGLVIVLVMTAFSSALVFTSAAHHVNAKNATERARALALAEGAVTLLLNDLDADAKAPVKDDTNYTLDGTTFVREYTPFDASDGTVRVEVVYLALVSGSYTPVAFATRATPTELYDRARLTVTAFRPGVERTIEIEMEQAFVMFDSAIVSDMIPTGSGGSGKNGAEEGHIVFNPKGNREQLYINGSIMANGKVFVDNSEITTNDANDYIQFAGAIRTGLAGTGGQIPDYTTIGSADQLFDFDRYIAAARAGAGREFTALADFVSAMNAANAVGTPLEGVTLLSLDDSDNKIDAGDIPGGINIRGTLIFFFESGTDPMFKVFLNCDCNVNAADLSGLDVTDPSTYTSGYDVAWNNEALRAHNFDITGGGFENFESDDDMPAIMFNTGIVDQHGSTNICGLIYGPSFVELENKSGGLQYYNGSILGGTGVYIEGNASAGSTVINFDGNTIDKLATQGGKGLGLRIIGWRVRG